MHKSTAWRLTILAACCLIPKHVFAHPVPTESTVSHHPPPWTPWTYTVLHNVLLREDGLLFYVPDHLAGPDPSQANQSVDGVPPLDDSHRPPDLENELMAGNWWDEGFADFKVHIVSKHNRSAFPDECMAWVERPTIMFHGQDFDHANVFHFLFDSLVRVWNTARHLGFFSMHAFLAREGPPTSEEAGLVVIQRRPQSWWNMYGLHALYDYLTPDQWTFPRGAGYCFKTLVIGVDNYLSLYLPPENAEDHIKRIHATAAFVHFVEMASFRIDERRGVNVTAIRQAYPSDPTKLRIGFVHRQRNAPLSRALVNEDELAEAVRRRYSDVEVSVLYFNHSLSETVLMARRLDIMIGMHGAGLSNALWMEPGGALIQLIPYGWVRSDGTYLLQDLFENLAGHINCTHFLWYNHNHTHSYLNYGESAGVVHPDPQQEVETETVLADRNHTEKAAWHYQDTLVDPATFLPVVDQAVDRVRANKPHLAHVRAADL